MNILKFIQQFPNEASCIAYLKEQKEQSGIVCKRCGCKDRIWCPAKLSFKCRHCHSRQSLCSGGVMEHSKLPFHYWIAAMFLLTSIKKSFSTEELRRQLGHKCYQSIWEMVCKLRDVMGKRDDRHQLTAQVELDEGFFYIELPEEEKDKPLKRERGSQKKAKVLVMVKSSSSEKAPKKGRSSKTVRHLKMQVISNLESEAITKIVKEQLETSVELTTDDSTSYIKFNEQVQSHQTVKADKNIIKTFLPWVHIAISNARRLLLGIHYKLKNEYFQYYLNEFCYKFNRRYLGEKIFDGLVAVAITYNTDFKSRTYNRTLCE
ncbi:IS1595 family transposase [Bacteroides eggerthii]|jgi:hypothetical protein|uniref:IS1595 family transposase n=1 Tax=Bacteroides eggerthii TaxID=28111 RepID=UPI0022DFEC8F|nr:IS1595 family transposase [Bacteroides eggerthii]